MTVPVGCTRCVCCCRWHPTRTCSMKSAPLSVASMTPKTYATGVCVCGVCEVCEGACVWVCVYHIRVCVLNGRAIKKRMEKSFRVELVRVDQKSLSLLIVATFFEFVCSSVRLFVWLDMSEKENAASSIRNNNSEQIVLQLISRTN